MGAARQRDRTATGRCECDAIVVRLRMRASIVRFTQRASVTVSVGLFNHGRPHNGRSTALA